MPVSERKKSFCSPTFRESERTGSSSTHRVYRECVGVNRVTCLGAMPVFFITRGEEDAAGQEASFGPPCSPHPRAKDVCVTPAHSVPQPPVWQGQRPPLSRPRCGTLGPRLTLGKSVGRDRRPFRRFLVAKRCAFVFLRTRAWPAVWAQPVFGHSTRTGPQGAGDELGP